MPGNTQAQPTFLAACKSESRMTSRGDYFSKRGRGSWRGRGYNDNRGGRGYRRGRGSWNVQQHSRGGGPSGYHRQPPESPQQPPASKRPRMIQSTLTDCPYKHWNMYLPEEGNQLVDVTQLPLII